MRLSLEKGAKLEFFELYLLLYAMDCPRQRQNWLTQLGSALRPSRVLRVKK